MTPRDFQLQLLDTIDQVHPFLAARGPLHSALREAFLAVPRHRFIQRYRRNRQLLLQQRELEPVQQVTEANLAEHLPAIYGNNVLMHVGAADEALLSSNSEPAFILRVLEQLDLQPGQRVLEIGSGGGWLAAVMAQVVGPEGKVTGIEIIPEMIAQSRQHLERHGAGNVEIVSGDGALGWADGAPYDRVIFTCACGDLPAAFYDQVRDGGKLIIPVRSRGGFEDVLVLRKQGDDFHLEQATLAYFVPLTGAQALPPPGAVPQRGDLPLWRELKATPGAERRLWFGGPGMTHFEYLTAGFRAFLGRIDPDFATVKAPGGTDDGYAFGLADAAKRSLALFQSYGLTGYGAPDAYVRCLSIYRLWCEHGMPGAGALRLQVQRATTHRRAPEGFPTCAGDSVFTWSLPQPPSA